MSGGHWPPSMLANRYELVQLLGRGGMGEVWQATDQILKRTVAVKLIRLGAGDDDHARARFAREAQSCAGLSHPNVVTIHDFGLQDDFAYMVMECLPGPDLGMLVRTRGPLPFMDALRYLSEAASGLAAAHAEGILHRDVKPANMMLTKSGSVKVLDFGIAALADGSQHLTATAQVIGTFSYLAPERAMGGPATVRSDLYSLGCMAVALLTGKPPFEGTGGQLIFRHVNEAPPHLDILRPDAPAGLVELVDDLLAKDPGRRPASASTVADRLDALRWPTGTTTLSAFGAAGATSASTLAVVVPGDPTTVSAFAPPTFAEAIDRTVLSASLSRPGVTPPAPAWAPPPHAEAPRTDTVLTPEVRDPAGRAVPPPQGRRRRMLVGAAALVSIVAASVFGLVVLRPLQAATAVPGLIPTIDRPVATSGVDATTAEPTYSPTAETTDPPPSVTSAPATTAASTTVPVAAPPAGTTQPATTTTTTQTTTTTMPATTSTTTTKVTTTTTTTKPATTTTTTTTSAPAPKVSVSKGAYVNTAQCTNSTCAYIVATTSNFPGNVTCTLYWEGTTAGSWVQGGNQANRTQYYYGYPGHQISVTCNGVTGSMVWY